MGKKWMLAAMIAVAIMIGFSAFKSPHIAWGLGAAFMFSVSFFLKKWNWRWWYSVNLLGFAAGLSLLAVLHEIWILVALFIAYHIVILIKNFGFKIK